MSEHDALQLPLRSARIAAGYRSAASFARSFGIAPTTYQHHENGRRALSAEQAKLYAAALKTEVGKLLYAPDERPFTTVLPQGFVGHGGTITMGHHPNTPAGEDGIKEAPRPLKVPDLSQYESLQVVGDAMFPRYQDGDVLFHDPLDFLQGVPPGLHGRECVVHLPDTRRMVRTVVHEGDGHYTLLGHGVPPEMRQQVLAASPIVAIIRPLPD